MKEVFRRVLSNTDSGERVTSLWNTSLNDITCTSTALIVSTKQLHDDNGNFSKSWCAEHIVCSPNAALQLLGKPFAWAEFNVIMTSIVDSRWPSNSDTYLLISFLLAILDDQLLRDCPKKRDTGEEQVLEQDSGHEIRRDQTIICVVLQPITFW